MSIYRREVRVGNSLLLRETSGSWIRLDVLSADGARVQVGVDAPVDYPSHYAGRDLVIGPVRVFVFKRVGAQKFQFGIRAPRRFSIARSDEGAPGTRQSDAHVENTGDAGRAPSMQRQEYEADTLSDGDSAHGERKPLAQGSLKQRHGFSEDGASLPPGSVTEQEMRRLLSRNLHRLR